MIVLGIASKVHHASMALHGVQEQHLRNLQLQVLRPQVQEWGGCFTVDDHFWKQPCGKSYIQMVVVFMPIMSPNEFILVR